MTPRRMWEEERQHPLLLSILYLVSFLATIVLSMLFGGKAQAQTTMGLHLASVHIPARDYQHNVNPGLYVKADTTWLPVTVGAYRNTLGRNSVYLAGVLERGPFALAVGAVTGYQRKTEAVACQSPYANVCTRSMGVSSGLLALMFAPSVRLPTIGGATPRLSIIPSLGRGTSTVLHLSVEWGVGA